MGGLISTIAQQFWPGGRVAIVSEVFGGEHNTWCHFSSLYFLLVYSVLLFLFSRVYTHSTLYLDFSLLVLCLLGRLSPLHVICRRIISIKGSKSEVGRI